MGHEISQIESALRLFFKDGDVFEIRALDAVTAEFRRPHVESGYFDYGHIPEAAKAVSKLQCRGVYVTVNPVNPALLARSANRMQPAGRDSSTKDSDILRRRWLLIDCDPVRPSGISATSEEHALAFDKAMEVREGLKSMGFPDPLVCDSGNGAQLMYRVELPCDDGGLVQACLKELSSAGDEKVSIDQTVHNPARIWRIPGTMNCKGDSLPERPHRLAGILDAPERVEAVSVTILKKLAAITEASPEPDHAIDISSIAGPPPPKENTFKIDDWIANHCPDAESPQPWNGGRKWIFPVCPFNAEHTNRSAAVFEQPSGALSFKCHHNGCASYGWEELRRLKEPSEIASISKDASNPVGIPDPPSLGKLVQSYPALRPPVIHGLLREGETMNVIASTKLGKSWLVIDLALAIAGGRPWLGMETVKGDVLIIDNELHCETSANRIPKVAAARGIAFNEVAEHLFIENLRGQLKDLRLLGGYFGALQPGRFKVIILDAFYRFLPVKTDENDNGAMARLYNYLDAYAERLKCAFILIHHTSKGNQSLKEITDVGAGAGSQARATDTHLILRRHEEEDAVVMEAVVRSWPPLEPRCLRWGFPLWHPADELSPDALKKEPGKKTSEKHEDCEAPDYSPESFAKIFVCEKPRSMARILEDAEVEGLSTRRIRRLIELAESERLIFRWNLGPGKIKAYATVEQPEDPRVDDSKRSMVGAFLGAGQKMAVKEIAELCEVSPSYVYRIMRGLEPQNLVNKTVDNGVN